MSLRARLTTAVALTLAPRLAAAAITWEPCAAPTLDDGFGPWRCVAAITGPGDLEDYWGNTARIDGDTMVLGRAIVDDPMKSAWIVVERANDEWLERARLVAWRDASVQLRGDTIAIYDHEQDGQNPRVQLYDRIDGAWTPTLALALSSEYPPFVLTDDRLFVGVPGDPWSVQVHHRIDGAWIEEASVTLTVPDSEAKHPPTLAADGDRLVAAFGGVIHVLRGGEVWVEEATLIPDLLASPPEDQSASIALDGEHLAVAVPGGDGGAHGEVHVYAPCASGVGWGVDAVLDVPPADWTPTLFLADGRLVVNTHELVGPPGVFIGSARIFDARDGWALEAELFTPTPHSNLEYQVASFDGDALLADLQPATEPYFYAFELYTRPPDGVPDPGATVEDASACDPGASAGTTAGAGADADEPSGCGCTTTSGAPSALLLLAVAAWRRRRRP